MQLLYSQKVFEYEAAQDFEWQRKKFVERGGTIRSV